MSNKLKYNIKTYVTIPLRDSIIQELGISKKTYYNKLSAKIGDKIGFEYCELLLIASILDVKLDSLITPETVQHYIVTH